MAMISLEPLRQHLIKESKNGSPTAILFAQFALFVNLLFLHRTAFISKHDPEGIISVLSYQIVALLLPYSKHLSQRKFLPRSWGGLKVNLIMNWVFLLLSIPLENSYEKSLGSLGVVLSVAVLALVLRVIIRPRSDFGFLGFLVGAAVSIANNLYKSGPQKWLVVAICFGLGGVRFLVVHNWLEVEDGEENQEEEEEEEESLLPISTTTSSRNRTQENKRISKSAIAEAVIVPGSYLYWDRYLIITNCPPHSDDDLISCIPYSVKKSIPSVVALGLCFTLSIALRLYLLLKVKKKVREISMELETTTVRIDAESREETIEQEVKSDSDLDGEIDGKNEDEETIIKSGSHPVGITADTLRQRQRRNKQSVSVSEEEDVSVSEEEEDLFKAMIMTMNYPASTAPKSFMKILDDKDLGQYLAIEPEFMVNLPAVQRGKTNTAHITVQDKSSGKQLEFEYCTHIGGDPCPVFLGGWHDFHRNKGLEPGDLIKFECKDDHYGPSHFVIQAVKRGDPNWQRVRDNVFYVMGIPVTITLSGVKYQKI